MSAATVKKPSIALGQVPEAISSPVESPTAAMVLEARKKARLTQTEAACFIHCSLHAWQQWEGKKRIMHPAFWELFLIKAARAIQ